MKHLKTSLTAAGLCLLSSVSSVAHAEIAPASLKESCRAALPAAQAEYATIEATLRKTAVPSEKIGDDTRRLVLQNARNALLANLVMKDALARLAQNPGDYELARTLESDITNVASSVMGGTCEFVDHPFTIGDEIFHSFSCTAGTLAYPSEGRSARYTIGLDGNSLTTCDTLSTASETPDLRTDEEKEEALLGRLAGDGTPEISLSQCMSIDLTTGTLIETNRVYAFVGVNDGCFGAPSDTLTDFESYFRHRMRYENCFGAEN